MMTRTPKNGWAWYQDGCHSVDIGCIAEGREKCTCRYHISDGKVQYGFDDFQEADRKWVELTGSESLTITNLSSI